MNVHLFVFIFVIMLHSAVAAERVWQLFKVGAGLKGRSPEDEYLPWSLRSGSWLVALWAHFLSEKKSKLSLFYVDFRLNAGNLRDLPVIIIFRRRRSGFRGR